MTWHTARRQAVQHLPPMAQRCVYVCVSVCVGNMQCYCQKQKQNRQVFSDGPPPSKKKTVMKKKKKKANQVKLENEVHIKGRTNVFRFLVFCRLKRKKEAFSLFLFSPVVAPSQKRAMGFLCDACKAA